MKMSRLGVINLGAFLIINAVHAAEVRYPWYQAYKDPIVKQRITRELESARGFVVRHKAKIIVGSIIAALVVGAGIVRRKARAVIIREFTDHDIDMKRIKQDEPQEYERLILLGAWMMASRIQPLDVRRHIIPELKQKDRDLFNKYPGLEVSLTNLLNLDSDYQLI